MIEQEDELNDIHAFYRDALVILNEHNIPFLLAGAFAHFHYTGILRDTKDMDVFCKPADYPRILKIFSDKEYEIQHTDARWLSKIFKGESFIDVIFNSVNNIWSINDTWFENSFKGKLFGVPVQLIGAEELIWCKFYVQNRERYDGADINHLILTCGSKLNWKKILMYLDHHWHLLLSQILQFQFVYPADRDLIPRWLFDELMKRAVEQFDVPLPLEKVCRGPIIDQTQYKIDITEWNYKVLTIKTI